MRIPRLYLGQDLAVGQTAHLDADQNRYISQVLRLRVGQELLIFDGAGNEYFAKLIAISRRDCTVEICNLQRIEPAPKLCIHLWLGISKGDRMDFAIQKSVELGVTTISPVYSARSVVQLNRDREMKRTERWRNIARNACEQSGRCHLPTVLPPRPLEEVRAKRNETAIVLDPGATKTLGQLPAPKADILVLVGPEGGLEKCELDRVLHLGFTATRLGRHVFRTETAPLAAIAAIQTLWGDYC